jgi:hypothetical protein
MTDVPEVRGGAAPLSPEDKKLYQQEYKQAANLFQEALEQYTLSPGNMYKQAEFKEVMEKAMQILNEAAQALKQDKLLKQNQKLQKDLEEFEKDPSSVDAQKNLAHDLSEAKRKV